MLERIDSAISTLKEEEQALIGRKSALDEQSSELEAALKRVRTALSALGVATATKTGRKGSSKPSPDKNAVRQAVIAVLQEQAQRIEQLRADVEHRVVERGFSRMGLSLRFKEVLGEDQFTRAPHDDQLIMLRDTAAQSHTSEFQENAAEGSS